MSDILATVKAALAWADEVDYMTPMNPSNVEALAAEVRATAVEIAHLREAFVVMERAYNANEASLAALRSQHAEAVEQAFRAGYIAGADEEDHDFPIYVGLFDAAWSRYQQERGNG